MITVTGMAAGILIIVGIGAVGLVAVWFTYFLVIVAFNWRQAIAAIMDSPSALGYEIARVFTSLLEWLTRRHNL